MPERHPGWVNGINDFEARLVGSAMVAGGPVLNDGLDPIRVRSGIKDAPGNPGFGTLGTNSVTVNAFQAVIQDPARPAAGAYVVTLDAPKVLPFRGADQTKNRTDLVIAEIDPTVAPGFVVRIVEGDFSDVDPAPPPVVGSPLHLKLGRLTVPKVGSAVSYKDTRTFTMSIGGILTIIDGTDLPNDGPDSLLAYRVQDGALLHRRGGIWQALRPPRGSVDTWHRVSFFSSWTDVNPPNYQYNTVDYTITEDGWVRLRGVARWMPTTSTPAAVGSTIFTLPSGYQPRQQTFLAAMTSLDVSPRRIDIHPDGRATCAVAIPGGGYLSFDNIAFPAAATYST